MRATGHTAPMAKKPKHRSIVEALTVPPGPVDLSSYDTRATPGFSGSKKKGKAALLGLGKDLSDFQERLFAEGRSGGGPWLKPGLRWRSVT